MASRMGAAAIDGIVANNNNFLIALRQGTLVQIPYVAIHTYQQEWI